MDNIRKALDKARLERGPTVVGFQERHVERLVEAVPTLAPLHGVPVPAVEPAPVADTHPAQTPRSTPLQLDPAVLERNRVLDAQASGTAASAFRLLRTQVLKRMRERGWRTLGVASARADDGKTTVAANLAVAIASDPRYTALLVDLDLRNPGTAGLFGAAPDFGVEDVLAGQASIPSAMLHPDTIDRLRLMPARAPVSNSSSVVASAACQELIGELRERYANRIVVFDTPPILEADDAVTLAGLFDCVLMVVAEGGTTREDVSRALSLIKETPVVGTVLNRSIEAIRSESYG